MSYARQLDKIKETKWIKIKDEVDIVLNKLVPNEQLKTPVNEAHSVPLLQLYFDFNASAWTWLK